MVMTTDNAITKVEW